MHPTVLAVISPVPAVIMLVTIGLVGFCAWKIRSTMREAARAQRDREMALVASLPGAPAMVLSGGLAPVVVVTDEVPSLDDLVLPSSGDAVPATSPGTLEPLAVATVMDPIRKQEPTPEAAPEPTLESTQEAVQVAPGDDVAEQAYLSLVGRLEALAVALEEEPAPGDIDPWRTIEYRNGWEAADTEAARRIRHELSLTTITVRHENSAVTFGGLPESS